jgi:hypothetical protein
MSKWQEVELVGDELARYRRDRFPGNRPKVETRKAPSRTRFSLGQNEFRDSKTRTASSWRSFDWRGDQSQFRDIYHYSTLMGRFVRDDSGRWWPVFLGVGHGSASDQNGMNQILMGLGIGTIRYRRDARGGGPRYVDSVSQETVSEMVYDR